MEGLSAFYDTYSNEQRAIATRHGIMRMLASVRKF